MPHPPKDLQTANGNSESIFHLPAKLIWGRTQESNCINLQRFLASWQPFVMSTVFSLQLATNASIVWPIKSQMAQHTHTHTHTEMYKNISINNGTWYISGRAHKALCAREREKESDKKWAISIKWRMEERQAWGKRRDTK